MQVSLAPGGVEPGRAVVRQLPIAAKRDVGDRAVLHRRQHRHEGIAWRRKAQGSARRDEGGEREAQRLVAAVGGDDLLGVQAQPLGDQAA